MQSVVIAEAVSNGRWYAQRARELGYLPVVVYPDLGPSPDYLHIREHAAPFLKDHGALIIEASDQAGDFTRLVQRLQALDPVCVVAGSELGVPLADRLASALGLPGNAPQTSSLRRDKFAMQNALKARGLRHIRGGTAGTPDEALTLARDIGSWPVVLKPLAGAATQGVHFCACEEELRHHAEDLLRNRDIFGEANNVILVQELIRGTEYIVNTASRQGRHVLTDLWVYNKIPIGAEGNAYDHAKLVTRLEPGQATIVAYAFEALTALGYEYGPSHMEIMVDATGPVLIEAGARPMGGDYPEDLLRESLGHYLVDRALTAFLDPEGFADLELAPYRPRKHLMIKYFISPAELRVDSAPALPFMKRLPSVRRVEMARALREGHTTRTVDLMSAPGHILLCHKDESILMEDYRLIRKMEASHFAMLFADSSGFAPHSDPESMRQAIRAFLEYSDLARGCLVILDDDADIPVLPEVATSSFSGLDRLPADSAYRHIVLHNGNCVADLAAYCAALGRLTGRLAPGGSLYCTPWGEKALGYGSAGMEIVFRLLGLCIEPPLSQPVPILRARKV